MTDGCWRQKFWCGIVCTSRGVFIINPSLGLKCEHFLKQIFGYTALQTESDQLSTCMVCLCKYHNWVTQAVGSLLNLAGPTRTRHYHGWSRAGKFWKFRVSRFQSLLYLFRIMICESMLFVIIEIRTRYMVFKFKNFFWTPLSLG
jgi:hypothetical protein